MSSSVGTDAGISWCLDENELPSWKGWMQEFLGVGMRMNYQDGRDGCRNFFC